MMQEYDYITPTNILAQTRQIREWADDWKPDGAAYLLSCLNEIEFFAKAMLEDVKNDIELHITDYQNELDAFYRFNPTSKPTGDTTKTYSDIDIIEAYVKRSDCGGVNIDDIIAPKYIGDCNDADIMLALIAAIRKNKSEMIKRAKKDWWLK